MYNDWKCYYTVLFLTLVTDKIICQILKVLKALFRLGFFFNKIDLNPVKPITFETIFNIIFFTSGDWWTHMLGM